MNVNFNSKFSISSMQGFNSLNSLEEDRNAKGHRPPDFSSIRDFSDSCSESSSSSENESIENMRKGRVYDLGQNLPEKEIKKIYKKVKNSIQNGEEISEHELVSGGEPLLKYQEKDTKMNLF